MRWRGLIAGTVAATLALVPAAHAVTFTVAGTADVVGNCTAEGACTSIRAALTAAAAEPGGDTIVLASGTYALGDSGELAINSPVTLQGAGARNTVIAPSFETRALDITAAATISHLPVSGGVAWNDFGGNIRSTGAAVTLDHVRVTGGNAGTGAGIANLHGTMTIQDSLIDGNAAQVTGTVTALEHAAGAIANHGDARSFSVDTVNPDPPKIDEPVNNGIVGARDIIAAGTAEALAKITVREGSSQLESAQASALGQWQVDLDGLLEGRHDLTFAAADAAGNASDPVTVTTNVDTIDPATTITSGPADGWNKPSATFAFVADEDATFECRLDALPQTGTYGPCTSPATFGELVNGTTYEFRVRAKDALGHTDSSPELRQFTVNTALPDTPVIDTPGENPHTQNSSTVVLAGTGSAGSTIVVNTGQTVPVGADGRWTLTLVGQTEGRHDYEVRATNAVGQTGTDGRTVFVDLTPPQTTIVSGPLPGGSNGVTFEFSSSEGGKQFTCAFTGPGDVPPAGKCSSPQTYSFLQEGGTYTLTVAAIDDAGNTDPTPASATFSYDHVPPVAQIDSTWPSPTNDNTPTIAFSADPGSTFACHVDAAQDAPCVSPLTLPLLADGDHTFSVTATDPSGNVQKDATTFKFVVDTVAPAAPTITGPKVDLSQSANSVLLQGTATPGTVRLFDGATLLTALPYDGGQWTFAVENLSEGPHVFTARTADAAGNVSEPSAPRTVTIDTVAPTVTIDSIPGPLTNLFTFDVAFTASEPAVTFECRHFWPGTPEPDVVQCTSAWSFRELPDGAHRFELTATDAAGNRGPTVSREVTIDSAVPTPVEPASEGTTFTFAAEEPGATFECRVEGPAGDSGFEPCASPKTYAGLPGGDYRFTLRTLDAAGNFADANPRAFSVAQTPQINPTPTATATATPRPTAAPTPTPEVGETVVVQPVSGKILVRVPGSSVFVALDATKGLPVGTEIDARNGKIRLTSEPGQGKPVQKADFYGGIFTVNQGSDGFVELRLTEALATCPKKSKKKASAAAKKPKSRKLWGDGKGKFRTRGQYSAATIRGTRWLVEDSCQGTLTRVANGVVSVRDTGKRKTILLRAGKSYLAKPKR